MNIQKVFENLYVLTNFNLLFTAIGFSYFILANYSVGLFWLIFVLLITILFFLILNKFRPNLKLFNSKLKIVEKIDTRILKFINLIYCVPILVALGIDSYLMLITVWIIFIYILFTNFYYNSFLSLIGYNYYKIEWDKKTYFLLTQKNYDNVKELYLNFVEITKDILMEV